MLNCSYDDRLLVSSSLLLLSGQGFHQKAPTTHCLPVDFGSFHSIVGKEWHTEKGSNYTLLQRDSVSVQSVVSFFAVGTFFRGGGVEVTSKITRYIFGPRGRTSTHL